jgi:hypothetical protein
MTALNFMLHEDGVIIAMDTLSLLARNKKPFKFVSKMFLLPHMQCVICGTGNMGAIIDWYSFVQKNILSNGIYQLNELSKKAIPQFMKEHNEDNSCTIYQFGLHELDDKFHGFAYRSTNNFQSEEIQYGFGIKPPDAFKDENGMIDFDTISSLSTKPEEVLAAVMRIQKDYDDKLDIDKRLGIGGKIEILYLSRDSMVIRNYDVFDDYDEIYGQMLEGLSDLNSDLKENI